MLSLYATLSFRYLRRRWFYALLIVASIASGVSLLVATRAINQTMARAAQASANPMAGAADFLITNAETPVDQELAEQLLKVPGVLTARPRIFENVTLLVDDNDKRTVLLVAIDTQAEIKDATESPWRLEISSGLETAYFFAELRYRNMKEKDKETAPPVVLGLSLDNSLPRETKELRVQSNNQLKPAKLTRVGTVDARGPAASLGGNVLILDLQYAVEVLGMKPGKVSRIDLTVDPRANRGKVREALVNLVNGRAEVRTPEEQDRAVQNVMAGMQVALLLCGVAALVVGLFLVYNALSVSVAERRHEIGILLAVGATRGQIRRLFAGEAVLLGLAGSLLGIPMGIGFAYLALQPVRGVLEEIFYSVNANYVEVDAWLIAAALLAGVATAVAAALVPAIQASHENPAAAVRRIPLVPTFRHRLLQLVSSTVMLLLGALCITVRDALPNRFGMYAGLGLVVVGALLATPLLTAVAAQALQPLARRFLGLEGRLAADNLIRAPGRTGLVIAALAAGVGLFMQTAGTIKSNRQAIRQWIDDSIAADLCVTSGSPVSAGGKSKPMVPELAREIEKIPGVERALPVRLRKPTFRDAQVMMIVLDADDYYAVDSKRGAKISGLELYKKLATTKNGVIISENFAALQHVHVGDVIPLTSPQGRVEFRVIGKLPDYSWNLGSMFVNRKDYEAYWDDPRVDVFDIYLDDDPKRWALVADASGWFGFNGQDVVARCRGKRNVQEEIGKRHGAVHGLYVLTREELQEHVDGMIQRLYGIAYAQQFVVLFVAALGMITALLISVLQRRREMGLLRAIGGARWHVLRCVLAEAALMGVIGSVIGFLVGVPLEWYALRIVILEESGYLFDVVVPWQEALCIGGAAVLTATLAGLGPAWFAVRQCIPEAIAIE
jgi:putative ABC transport system permease protein